ncbi:MAG: alpha/beta hydrolase [Gammaproteobacteria bacterium]|nr:alpha/beta hydrolase [Gammaproteobacteria bacterium]
MRELSLAFGPQRSLIGTLTLPEQAISPAQCGLVLFNAGVVHRVGPHRINVKLARRMAQHGMPTIRFDLHGIGDSARPAGAAEYRRQVTDDLSQAMNLLQRSAGVQRFAVLGFCSGAMPVYWAAQADARIRTLILYDDFGFPTMRSRLRFFWLRLCCHGLTPAAWIKYAHAFGRMALHLIRRDRASIIRGAATVATAIPASRADKRRLARGLAQLAGDGVKVVLLQSGDDFSRVNYADQTRAALNLPRSDKRLIYRFLEAVDHAVTSTAAQRAFLDAVCAELPTAAADPLPLRSTSRWVPAKPAQTPSAFRTS